MIFIRDQLIIDVSHHSAPPAGYASTAFAAYLAAMASDFLVGAVGADDAPKSPPRSANDGTLRPLVHAYADDAEVADCFEFVSDDFRASSDDG